MQRLCRAASIVAFLVSISITDIYAQSVGIGTETPNTNAILELVSPKNNQGLLVPRLTTDSRTSSSFVDKLTAEDNGLMVYDSEQNKFYFWVVDQWIELAVGNLSGLPDQVGQNGKFLSTDGSIALWSDLDFNNLTNIPSGLSDGDDTEDADADASNEIQDISLSGNEITITSGSTIDLSSLQDGIGTDDQNASEVEVSPVGNLISSDVQSALEELQSEIVNAASTAIPDNAVTTAKINDGAVTDEKIVSLDFSKITSFPADLADGDSDTQLTETEVDDFVGNNGFLSSESDPTIPANIKDGIDWTEVSNIPTDIADGDDNTQLSEAEVDAFAANNGYLASEVDGSITNEIQDIAFDGSALSITSGSSIDLSVLSDGTGTDDQSAGEVVVSPSGDLKSTDVQSALQELQSEIVAAASAAIPDNAITTVKISNGAVTDEKITSVEFSKLTSIPTGLDDGDDDTQLTEAEVDGFVANNGYLIAEADGSDSNEIQDLQFSAGVITLSSDPGTTQIDLSDYDTDASDDFDGNYNNLSNKPTIPTNTSDLTNDSGFLTAEVDGSNSNEIQDLQFSAGVITLSSDPGSTQIDLSDYDTDASDDFNGNYNSLSNRPSIPEKTSALTNDSGFLSAETDPTVPESIKDGIDWTELSGIPTDIANGDADTQLSETEVDDFVANNGYLTSVPSNSVNSSSIVFESVDTNDIADDAITDDKISSMNFNKLTNVPSGLADGDNNTQLSESQVDNYVSDNGYLQATVSSVLTLPSGPNDLGTPTSRLLLLKGNGSGESIVSTIGAGTDGQEVIILNATTANIQIAAGGAGNGDELIIVNGTTLTFSGSSTLILIYSSDLKAWVQTGGSSNVPN